MGQKIHPYGYRVGITQPHSVRWFANTYQYPQYVFEDFLLRQSLFKVLPVENLPRQRTEDISETKLVRIKIERLIRNNIKIKLYVTSPQSASNLFEIDSTQKTRKEFSNSKSDKRTSSSKGDSKKEIVPQDRNLLLVNILKKSLNKKITKLHILKLQNIVYKMETLKNMIEANQSLISDEVFSVSRSEGKQSLNVKTQIHINHKNYSNINNIVSCYSNFKNLIYGIKFCLNKLDSTSSKNPFSINSVKKFQLKFQLLQLKKQLCINLVNQFQIYQQFEKQKLLNMVNGEIATKDFELEVESRFLKLNQYTFYWENRLLQTTKLLNIIFSKLQLKLESLQSKLEKNQESFSSKVNLLMDVLKVQYLLIHTASNKETDNSFLLQTLTPVLNQLKSKLFFTNTKNQLQNKNAELINNLNVELNNLFLEKQKILKIVTNLNCYDEVLKNQLIKTKNYILALCFIKSKLIKLNSNLINFDFAIIDQSISNSILSISFTEQCLKKNQNTSKHLVFIKLERVQNYILDIEKTLLETNIVAILKNLDEMKNIIKLSQFYRKFSELNKPSIYIEFVKNGSNQYFNILRYKTIKTFKIDLRKNSINILRCESLLANKNSLVSILKDYPLNKYSRIKAFYKFCKVVLDQRLKIKQILELKIKSLLININQNKNSNVLCHSVRNYNEKLNINNLYIKQLKNWLTLLKQQISTNYFSNQEICGTLNMEGSLSASALLRSRIQKIDRYLYKLIPLKTNNSLGKIERILIYINFTILKQKLVYELLQMQRSSLFSSKINNFLIKNKEILTKTNLTTLNKILPIVKNRIIQLQTFFSTISSESEIAVKQPLISEIIPLKTNLQNLLKTNYEKSFVVLQTRRKVFNNFINRVGGHKKSQQNLPFDLNSFNSSTGANILNNNSMDLVQQKIFNRKPIKTLSTRKQKFLAKKTIKKKMKKFLIEMALKNNYNHIFSLKNIYDVKTLSKLCDNFTNIQTFPKVSVIEFVKISQPKQYAVCVANFIVENLEKRFSFRSTMKKAAEQTMSTPNVKGIKIQVSGRLNGAEIARTEWLRDGRVPLQTLRANIDYSYKTAKTIYGVLGVKVWIFKTTTANFNE
jgi:ribosomal protein S3